MRQYEGSFLHADSHIDKNYMLMLTERLNSTISVHGFRACFRGWCTATKVEYETAEACLAHAVGNAVGRSYDREDRLELRAPIMESWGHYCNGTSNVVALRAVA
jgi:hypothetical protein